MRTWLTADAPRCLWVWGLRWWYEIVLALAAACAAVAGGYWATY